MSYLAMAVLFVSVTVAVGTSVIVDTEFGQVEGTQSVVKGVTVNSWLGVPFAAAPVANLRWKPPTNPQPWSGVKVTDSAFLCPQSKFSASGAGTVFVVWIHGGGNTNTMPSSSIFNGSMLVARSVKMPVDQSEPVIMVAIGYRMGGLGFLAMPELTSESPHKSSGNYGVLDQIFALQWIKRNIHSFGGIRAPRVVLFGESAGAYDISTLLASPLAYNLFDGAIMESTYEVFYWKTLETAEKTGASCAAKNKCQFHNVNATLACLRALPVEEAYNCQAGILKPVSNNLEQLTAPNVDGYFLKCQPLEALREFATGSLRCGQLSQAPIMIGSSLLEGDIFAAEFVSPKSDWGSDVTGAGLTAARGIIDLFKSGKTIDKGNFQYVMAVLYPVKAFTKIAADLTKWFAPFLAPLGATLSPTNATVAALARGDLMFTCSTEFTSSVIAKSLRESYLYLFNHTPSNDVMALAGPTHTSEMPYVFGTFDAYAAEMSFGQTMAWTPNAVEQKMSQDIMDYWLNFARYLNPNGNGGNNTESALWPPAGCGEDNSYMVFGSDGSVAVNSTPYNRHPQCALWLSYSGIPAGWVNNCGGATTKHTTKASNIDDDNVSVVVGVSVTVVIIIIAVVVALVLYFVRRQRQRTESTSRYATTDDDAGQQYDKMED